MGRKDLTERVPVSPVSVSFDSDSLDYKTLKAVKFLRFNSVALSDPKSCILNLTSEILPDPFRGLVDSGSSNCFIDSDFVKKNDLVTEPIDPIPIMLIDGTVNNHVSSVASLPVRFPSGEVLPIPFYVTPLESTCAVVLGHDWLLRYNPLIDWRLSSVTFRDSVKGETFPKSTYVRAASLTHTVDPVVQPSLELSRPEYPVQPIDIGFLTATSFMRACKVKGSSAFKLNFPRSQPAELHARAASLESPDLSSIPSEYHDYADVFSKQQANSLPPHRQFDLQIVLEEGTSPPLGPIYSLSPRELEALREFLDENLASGFIRPSTSPHGAPVLFVKKKDGSLRLCVDFRGLNKITKKDRYPLPLISDLLDSPRKARIYSKIDLQHAFHLVRVAEGDEWKTAFRTRYGSFEWLVMPFGLSNAPSVFQRFVNEVFADLLDTSVVAYIDDLLVYSDSLEEHVQHVREVLRRLRHHKLYASAKKCVWHTDKVEFLGFVLGTEGLSMDPSKVEVIQKWPPPRRTKDIQSFLGFANFYRRFIHDYSKITVPLTRLTRKGTDWDWTDDCQRAFDALKAAFTTAPVLTHWIPDAPLVIETDASDYALAAILSIYVNGDLHPIAFHSRTFTSPELNYDVHDKELLAIFEAFKRWRHYLEGSATPIDVITDHKNLVYFSSTKMLTRRQARWSEYLSQFNLVIRFRPGRQGAKPDALTRRWDVYAKEGSSDYATVNPHNFRPMFSQDQLASSLRATYLLPLALRGAKIMDIAQLHEDIRAALPHDPLSAPNLASPSNPWSSTDGLLRFKGKIFVPDQKDLRLRVLQDKHDHILAGHFGQNKTLELVQREYYWPDLRDFVQSFAKTCDTCLRNKSQRHKPYGFLKQLPIPDKPWNSISMDFIEKLPESDGFTDILVIVDRLTKQVIFIPTVDTITAPELAKLFVMHVFSKHGVPSHVTSDRGSEFVSRFFRSLGTALNMKLHFTSGYHPEGDGQTERMNQTLEQYLRVYCNYQQDNWSELLPLAEFAYNNSVSATTGITPFFANKGYHPNIEVHLDRTLSSDPARIFVTDLGELHEELKQHIADAQRRYQHSADSRRSEPPAFKIGDKAYVKSKFISTTRPSKKLAERFLGPYEIIAQPGTLSYTLKLPPHMRAIHPVFHVSMLEPHVPNTIPNRMQPPPPPVEVDSVLEYEVAEVLDSKLDRRCRIQLHYYARWLGYEGTDEEFSWINASDIANAPDVVATFHEAYPDKPGPDPKFFKRNPEVDT